ncbi:STAS domain-containing protein [Kitasatospora sp. NPDC057904]|uniref:STAS domain-containing protein n=1 Tax=unclassified Kitasatospora TaxID=2633591 RepID=UPI0036DA7570
MTASERAVRASVCRVAGEADHETRPALDEALAEAVAAGPDLLVVDVAPLTFCDSAWAERAPPGP